MQLLRLHKVGEKLEKSWKNIGKDFLKVLKIVQKITKQKII